MKHTILALGAHPDDIEWGCGGTLFRFIEDGHQVIYRAFSYCTDLPRNKNIKAEWREAMKVLDLSTTYDVTEEGAKDIGLDACAFIYDFPNRHLPEYSHLIRRELERLKGYWNPTFILTHHPLDRHQDHYTLYEEALRVFTYHTIWGYETPKHSIHADIFVPLDNRHIEAKFKLLKCYKSQDEQRYMYPEYINAVLHYYALKYSDYLHNTTPLYAEGFHHIKTVMRP